MEKALGLLNMMYVTSVIVYTVLNTFKSFLGQEWNRFVLIQYLEVHFVDSFNNILYLYNRA